MNKITSRKVTHASTRLSRFMWAVIFIALATLIMSYHYLPERVSYMVGDRVESNLYYSGSATTFVNNVLTEEAKTEAANNVEPVYRIDESVVQALQDEVDRYFLILKEMKLQEANTDAPATGTASADALPADLSAACLDYALQCTDTLLDQMASYLKNTVASLYSEGIAPSGVEALKTGVVSAIEESGYRNYAEELLVTFAESLDFQPNLVQDQAATLAAAETAMEQVEPVSVTVRPGELILAAGQTVTESDLETLTTLGLRSGEDTRLLYLGLLFFVALLFCLFGTYLRLYAKQVWDSSSKIVLLGLLIVFALFIGKLVTLLDFGGRWQADSLMGFLVPVPAFSMLVAALFGHKVALFFTLFIAIFVGIMGSDQLIYSIAAMVGGIVGIYQITKMDQRSKYVLAALYVGGSYALTVAAWGLMGGYSWEYIGVGIVLGLINGLFSAILTIGSLPFWEGAFGITTEIRLLELCNSNQPLLRRMMVDAPGTYQHSILVANMAEAAAEELGANALLVRVGAYYHDIGKLKRPYFFIENQGNGENPHDKMQPTLSVLIISSHPKEGVEMAKKYKLPEAVIDIIAQHHGTGFAGFFYRKAKELGMEDIKEEDFRYPGPKPQSKEAAIVLLADSVQAAIHSMKNPTKGQIDGKIREIIRGKFEDGQLEESPLTFRDLDTIAAVFSRVLAGVSHHRISYTLPGDNKKKKVQKDDGNNQQPAEKDPVAPGVAEPAAADSPGDPADGAQPPVAPQPSDH